VARGKVAIAAALLNGEIEPDDEALRQLDLCLSCNACVAGCPSGVRIDDVILAARAEVVRWRRRVAVAAAAFAAVKRPRVLKAGAAAARAAGPRVRARSEDGLGVPRLPLAAWARRSCEAAGPPADRRDGSAGAIAPSRRVVFYPGMITFVYPEIGRALVATLGAAGLGVSLPRREPLLRRAHAHARDRRGP